jgi:hypothetical protein
MAEAWRIFRETYNYPYVSFRSIGRHCFASALRRAWARARNIVQLAALGREELVSRINSLRTEHELLGYSYGRGVDQARAELRASEARIQDALALCPESGSKP